jgi:alpha-glucosidase
MSLTTGFFTGDSLPLERFTGHYGADLDGVQLPFNFQLLQSSWNARAIAEIIARYEGALPRGAWPNWVLGNHDISRIASRVGVPQARVAAVLLLTLRGTPTLYYGDELGMTNVAIPSNRVQDRLERNVPGKGLGRDPSRTPMQWDVSPPPDLALLLIRVTPGSPSWDRHCKDLEHEERSSHFMLYGQLLELRRSLPALAIGDYGPITAAGDLLAYMRHLHDQRCLIALNFGAAPCTLSFDSNMPSGRVLLSTHMDRAGDLCGGQVSLRANEGVIVALAGNEGSSAP